MFKKIAAIAALAASIAVQATPVLANTRQSNLQHHAELAEAVVRNNVNLYLNPSACASDDGKLWGFYMGQRRAMVICQENSYPGGPAVDWTEEDLDTLRHETQHMIQDCMVGSNHDHQLGSVYTDPVGFALSVLGQERAEDIVNLYRSNGANDHVLVLELEAFAVAELNNPLEQVQDLKNYCGR